MKHNPCTPRVLSLTLTILGLSLLTACGGGGDGSIATPVPTLTSGSITTPRYGQALVLTLNGNDLDRSMTVSSAGCAGITRSTAAPYISTATTAYYTCKVTGQGSQQFTITRGLDGSNAGSLSYTVPAPQVTMTVSDGAALAGSFVITLAPQQAPVTVDNFLDYVNAGFYDGSIFHRSIANFVIQGGGYDAPLAANATPTHKTTNPPITLEDNAGLSNTRLTVAMARLSTPVDSATSEFFINLVDNTGLDRNGAARGYAVFGSVTTGASLIDAIAAAPCVAAIVSTCLPVPNIVINSAVQTQ